MASIVEPASRPIAPDDRFFLTSAFVMAFVIVAGFSLQFAMGRSSFGAPAIVHVHAVVFMGWVAIYVAQSVFAANRATALHRRLGWIATFWVAAMVVLGIAVTVVMVRRGQVPFFFPPAYFLIMNPLSVLTFAALTAAAVVLRRRTMWHRRLHFCGMAILLGPAFGRLLPVPFMIPWVGWGVFAALILFPLAGIVADLRRTGRVHRAWWWGLGSIVAMQIAMDAIAFSPLGAAIYDAAVAGSPGAAISPYAYPPSPVGPLITGR